MLDRVREALFSILADEVEGARVLDLFAGSGSLGLEALSRGAVEARLVERDRRTARVLAANVESLGLEDVAIVSTADALAPESWGTAADLVFLDPPYPFLRTRATRLKVLATIHGLLDGIVTPGGPVVFHAPRREVRAREFGSDVTAEDRDYGTNTLWFLTREDGAS
jgi:16S rRNA (guanine966-N2)-methyltransferase